MKENSTHQLIMSETNFNIRHCCLHVLAKLLVEAFFIHKFSVRLNVSIEFILVTNEGFMFWKSKSSRFSGKYFQWSN